MIKPAFLVQARAVKESIVAKFIPGAVAPANRGRLVVKAAKKRTGSYSRDRSNFQGSREIAVACLIGFLSIFILAVVHVLHEMWIRSD
jgi:hypothetical protein